MTGRSHRSQAAAEEAAPIFFTSPLEAPGRDFDDSLLHIRCIGDWREVKAVSSVTKLWRKLVSQQFFALSMLTFAPPTLTNESVIHRKQTSPKKKVEGCDCLLRETS